MKLTLLLLVRMLLLVTLHAPLPPVVQAALPVMPPLQFPLTFALATGMPLLSRTVILTRALQVRWPPTELLPSKSPTCKLFGGDSVSGMYSSALA